MIYGSAGALIPPLSVMIASLTSLIPSAAAQIKPERRNLLELNSLKKSNSAASAEFAQRAFPNINSDQLHLTGRINAEPVELNV